MKKDTSKLIDTAFDTLYADVCAGKSDSLKRYMKLMATFHSYSYFNTLLIMQQMPEATRVAGFTKWKSYNCHVKKGESGILVLAPRTSKYIEEEGKKVYLHSGIEFTGNQEDIQTHLSFFPVYVFDVSQVEGDIPEDMIFFKNLGNDFKKMYIKLHDIIGATGVQIVERDIRAQGTSLPGKILINKTLDYNNKLITLIHEYAHEILHQNKDIAKESFSRKEEECQAESVSYVVAAYLGFENTFSKDYVMMWGATKENFMKAASIIKKGSDFIIDLIEKGMAA